MNPFKASEPTSPAFYSSDNPQINQSPPSLRPTRSTLRSAILSSTNLLQEFSQFHQKMTQLSSRKHNNPQRAQHPSLLSKNSAFRLGSLPCIQTVGAAPEGQFGRPLLRRTLQVGPAMRGDQNNRRERLY